MKRLSFTIALLAIASALTESKAYMPLLDYESGEITQVEASDADAPTCVRKTDGGALIIEWTVKCAYVSQSSYYPGTVMWSIPGFYSYYEADDKPFVTYTTMRSDIDKNKLKVTVEAAEYKDFTDTKLSPQVPLLPDCMGCDPILYEITPYTGFYPENVYDYIEDDYSGNKKGDKLVFLPTAYDYEHSVVRAYTYVRFRIENTDSGINETEADADRAATYFDLTGRKVARPVKGRIYVEHSRNGYQQIIY